MKPSDFRYNPFSDVSTAVVTTERHIVPSDSPYIVALNEIPQKTSPSTMTVNEIDATGVAGASFADVAAIPEAGQFWADYNTGAAGSENWNTGKLLFNASDAGKMIEVTYTATGTLASVTSNRYPSWWLDRGDGSDGDFAPTANTTISGLKQYKSVFIPAGVTVTVSRWVIIQCQGACIINGTLTADGQGAAGGAPYQSGASGWGAGRGGAGGNGSQQNGGPGGSCVLNNMNIVVTEDIADNLCKRVGYYYGAGGGGSGRNSNGKTVYGGAGGGCIEIICKQFQNQGTITANGSSAWNDGPWGGTGGGGAIVVVSESLLSQGNISVEGGEAGWKRVIELEVM